MKARAAGPRAQGTGTAGAKASSLQWRVTNTQHAHPTCSTAWLLPEERGPSAPSSCWRARCWMPRVPLNNPSATGDPTKEEETSMESRKHEHVAPPGKSWGKIAMDETVFGKNVRSRARVEAAEVEVALDEAVMGSSALMRAAVMVRTGMGKSTACPQSCPQSSGRERQGRRSRVTSIALGAPATPPSLCDPSDTTIITASYPQALPLQIALMARLIATHPLGPPVLIAAHAPMAASSLARTASVCAAGQLEACSMAAHLPAMVATLLQAAVAAAAAAATGLAGCSAGRRAGRGGGGPGRSPADPAARAPHRQRSQSAPHPSSLGQLQRQCCLHSLVAATWPAAAAAACGERIGGVASVPLLPAALTLTPVPVLHPFEVAAACLTPRQYSTSLGQRAGGGRRRPCASLSSAWPCHRRPLRCPCV
eukprot:1157957-Pelagomonas_calceolata.AAC.2